MHQSLVMISLWDMEFVMRFEAIVRLTFGTCVLFLVVAACSCRRDTVDSIPRFPERQFTNSWSMDQSALERFKGHVNQILVGDDITRLINVVGLPDKDETSEKNERVRTFVYYVTRQRADTGIEGDKVVIVGLNRNAKVTRIYSNVEGIPSKNWFPESGATRLTIGAASLTKERSSPKENLSRPPVHSPP